MKPALIRAAVVILTFRLVWMYLIPSWNQITTDFQNYYTAAWAVYHHRPLADLYDISWFQRETARAGLEGHTALFNYFTPISALLMWPIAGFQPLQAMRIWIVLNLAALLATVLLLARFLHAAPMFVALVALLGGDALGNNFAFGQFYAVLTLLLVCAIAWPGRRAASASCVAVATGVKVFPAFFIVQSAVQRRWKALVWAAVALVLLGVMGMAVMGWIPHRVYIEEVLPRAIRGEIQDPYNVRWNTLQALLRRALVFEPSLNPHPIANVPWLYFFIRTFVVLTISLMTLWTLRRKQLGFIEYGSVMAAISLITPSQASYHQILFFPAFTAAIHNERDARMKVALALVFTMICSNYMGALARRDSGWSMLVAFPRVYLVAGMWVLWLTRWERRFRTGAIAAILGFALLLAGVSAVTEWRRWKADDIDGAAMARPQEHGMVETDPTVGAAGLFYSTLTTGGYVLHPSAFGSGVVYESRGAITGRLANGVQIRWSGAAEPSLGPASVVAIGEDGQSIVERTEGDSDWHVALRRDTVLHDAAISPDGKTIAFAELANGRYRIAEWSRASLGVRTLLEGGADYRYPKYAPHANEMAFATNERGNWDVGRVSLNTLRHEILTSSYSNDFMPAYSPDGTRLYFASDRRRGYRFTAIYVISLSPPKL
jgi:hypothetical protein